MNENKNLIPVILVVVIVLGLGFLVFRGQNQSATLNEENKVNESSDTSKKEEVKSLPFELKDGTYKIDPSASKLSWTAKKKVLSSWVDTGSVSVKEGSVVVQEGIVKSGSVVVDMTSVSSSSTGAGSGQEKLANHLKSSDFFDVEKYPTSNFAITKVSLIEGGNYQVEGNLTIKDVTKPFSTGVMVNSTSDGKVVLKGKLTIDRTEYNVKFGSDKFFENLGDKAIEDKFDVDMTLVGSFEAAESSSNDLFNTMEAGKEDNSGLTDEEKAAY